MALGDTYSIHCRVYVGDWSNRSNLSLIDSNYYIFIPYAPFEGRLSANQYIVRYGLVTGNYDTFISWCPYASTFTIYDALIRDNFPNIESETQNFRNYFPRVGIAAVLSSEMTSPVVIFESIATGKIWIPHTTAGSTCSVFPTKQDYIDNTNEQTFTGRPIKFSPSAGSGGTLGEVTTMFYSGVDSNGLPTDFHTIDMRGFRSTQNSIQITAYGNINTTLTSQLMYTFGGGPDHVKPIPSGGEDPFTPGGESEPGGGEGDYDESSDPIDFPPLPPTSAVDTGFITLYNPSTTQLQNLASYMWSGAFDLNTFRKIFADPMDCILGLSIVPVVIPNGGTKTVTVGNISTGVSMTVAQSQYVEIDCGSLSITEFWGAYLDYEPYTKFSLYLPYIGIKPLSADDVMTKTIHVKYHVDILSGACVAYVKCGDSVLYSYIGQCSSSIPISGNDWTNVINGALNIATAIGTCVATGGASAPMTAVGVAATAVNSLKPAIEKSGSLSGTGGLMGIQKPYLIAARPIQALPTAQNHYTGYPSFVTSALGSLSGYTEIEFIHLDNIPATDQELAEIENLLKGGVIL